jgi:hypothetical protein
MSHDLLGTSIYKASLDCLLIEYCLLSAFFNMFMSSSLQIVHNFPSLLSIDPHPAACKQDVATRKPLSADIHSTDANTVSSLFDHLSSFLFGSTPTHHDILSTLVHGSSPRSLQTYYYLLIDMVHSFSSSNGNRMAPSVSHLATCKRLAEPLLSQTIPASFDDSLINSSRTKYPMLSLLPKTMSKCMSHLYATDTQPKAPNTPPRSPVPSTLKFLTRI